MVSPGCENREASVPESKEANTVAVNLYVTVSDGESPVINITSNPMTR